MKTSGGRLVLDTSAYAQFRAGDEAVHELLSTAEAVLVPAVVVGELEAGFALGTRARENRVTLEEFLAEPFVAVLPVDARVARRYGVIFAALRRAGTPIPVNDIWIAATAMEAGAKVVTFDRDYARIPHLERIVLKPE